MAVVTNQFFIVYEKESGLAFMDQKQREWKGKINKREKMTIAITNGVLLLSKQKQRG